jgi:hypothetical protein
LRVAEQTFASRFVGYDQSEEKGFHPAINHYFLVGHIKLKPQPTHTLKQRVQVSYSLIRLTGGSSE